MRSMKALLILVFATIFSSCGKDEDAVLKETLTISIFNDTEFEYKEAKLYAGSNLTAGYEFADSIKFTLSALSDTIIYWKPKILLKGEGSFQFQLSEDKKENFGYVVGKSNADGYEYEITIIENKIEIIAK